MNILKVKSTSPANTRKLGEMMGKHLFPGAVVVLSGELGSGKTVLSQGILKGLGVKDRYMISPSFVLIKEYKGRLPVYHMDLFRLKNKKEFNSLGIKEYLEGRGVAIIEWGDKARYLLPVEYIEAHIEFTHGMKDRAISFILPGGRRYCIIKKYLKLFLSRGIFLFFKI